MLLMNVVLVRVNIVMVMVSRMFMGVMLCGL